jgi:hypothetical protein
VPAGAGGSEPEVALVVEVADVRGRVDLGQGVVLDDGRLARRREPDQLPRRVRDAV